METKKNYPYTCKKCKRSYNKKRHRRDKLFPGKSGYFCETCYHTLQKKAMSPSKKAAATESRQKSSESQPESAQEHGQSHDHKIFCAFCGFGGAVTNVCGKLYHNTVDGELLAAHRKCMQYSAGLVQYTFASFGGFKVDKVKEEINRGRRLPCHACKTKKTGVRRRTGATAGCAWEKCKKTFHYYCAAKYAIASRRTCMSKKGMEIDLYRVFCSDEHKEKYIRHCSGLAEHSSQETDEEGEGRSGAGFDSESENSSLQDARMPSISQNKQNAQGSSAEEDESGEGWGAYDIEDDAESDEVEERKQSKKRNKGRQDSKSEHGDDASIEMDLADDDFADADDLGDSASGEDKAETEDDNPYKSLPPTSSENSDSEKESRQQVKKIKATKKKSEDKKAKSEIKSPRQVKEPNGQVSTPTKKGSQHEEDICDDSSEMEVADRVKMSPRKRKKKLKDKEDATATSTSSSKARKKDNSSSPAVRSQKIVKPRYSLNTYFTSDDILSENSEENNNDNDDDDDDGDGDEDDDDHSAGLRTNGNAAAAVSQESELPKSKPKKKETTPDILKKRTPASGSETTQQSEKKTPGSSPGTTHRIGKNTTLSSSGTTPEQEKNTSGSPRTSLKTGEKTSGNSSRTPKQAQQDVGGETRGKKQNQKSKSPKGLAEPGDGEHSTSRVEAAGGRKDRGIRGNTSVEVHSAHNDSVLPECVLVIPLDVVKFQPVSATVRAHLAEELSVDDQHVHDWTSVAPLPLPAGCMIHYFADIALHVSLAMKKERDWASFGQLLVDHDTIKRKFQDDYLQKVGLYVDDLLDDVINTIKKTLHVTLRKAAERNCAMGEFSSTSGVDYLALAISDASDPDQHIRERLHMPKKLFEWKHDIDFDPSSTVAKSASQRQLCLAHEVAVLKVWLSKMVTQVFQFHHLPVDADFRVDFDPLEADCVSQLEVELDQQKVSMGCSKADAKSLVLLFHKMDKAVVNFELYLQRVLKRCLDEHSAKRIVCIIPACNLENKGYPVTGLSSHKVKVSSALDPTEKSVVFVIMEIYS